MAARLPLAAALLTTLTACVAALTPTPAAAAHGKRHARPSTTVGGRCAPPAGAAWAAGFEAGSFGEWSWWGQGDPTYAGLSVVDARSAGIPACEGQKVARFAITRRDIAKGNINSKLYKGFSLPGSGRTWAPADVSGSYVAWFYLPRSFRQTSAPGVNLFQFKTELYSRGGESEPSWELDIQSARWLNQRPHHTWVGRAPADPGAPVAVTNYGNEIDGWANDNGRRMTGIALPRGRWFEVRAVVVEGRRIDWYVAGRHLVTNYQRQFPVGPIHGGDAENWTFGIGNYSVNVGVIYADAASYTPTPHAAAVVRAQRRRR